MNDARAAVEAWMRDRCPHHVEMFDGIHKYECPDCLLAFAAAQRDLQTEAAYEEGRRVGERVGRAEELVRVQGLMQKIQETAQQRDGLSGGISGVFLIELSRRLHEIDEIASAALRARREGPG